MVDVGIRGERLVRGEPTEVREVRALMQANVQVLELVVADVIKALIEAGRMDKRLAKAFADEFAQQVNAGAVPVRGGGLKHEPWKPKRLRQLRRRRKLHEINTICLIDRGRWMCPFGHDNSPKVAY